MTSLIETCAICHEDIDPKNIKIVHEYLKKVDEVSKANWRHQFCGPCIDNWINMCFKKKKHPTCPMCPDFKIPKQLFPNVSEESDYEIAHNAALERFNYLMCDYEETGVMPVFMGIMICINNNCIYKFANYDMGLTMNSSILDIKNWIRANGKQIYTISGFTSRQNIFYNLSLQNWLQWKYPDIRVTDLHYGMPPFTDRVGTLNANVDDSTTLEEFYINYQTKLGIMHLNNEEYSNRIQHHLRKIYRRSNLEWNPTGPDDPGYLDDLAYSNKENPIIPLELRAYQYDNRSTDNSLAWLTLHLEYQ